MSLTVTLYIKVSKLPKITNLRCVLYAANSLNNTQFVNKIVLNGFLYKTVWLTEETVFANCVNAKIKNVNVTIADKCNNYIYLSVNNMYHEMALCTSIRQQQINVAECRSLLRAHNILITHTFFCCHGTPNDERRCWELQTLQCCPPTVTHCD